MENQQTNPDLFGLQVDSPVKMHLAETAKWGKFLAVIGFILCGLLILAGLVALINLDNREYSSYDTSFSGTTAMVLFSYIILSVLYFFPCLFLLRFSNKMKDALAADDQAALAESFQNLKVLFRYFGILTIIVIAFYVLAFVANIFG